MHLKGLGELIIKLKEEVEGNRMAILGNINVV
jgi:hypothetical protein